MTAPLDELPADELATLNGVYCVPKTYKGRTVDVLVQGDTPRAAMQRFNAIAARRGWKTIRTTSVRRVCVL